MPSVRSRFEHLFMHYGAGRSVLIPLLKSGFWAWFSWVLIVLGIVGWIVLLLYIDPARD